MNKQAYQSPIINNSWLNTAEIIAVSGSICGAIASVLLQKYLYVSLPLSASVALNLLNRQRITNLITSQVTEIEQLEKQSQQHESILSQLSQELERQNEITSSQSSKISQETQKIRQDLLQVNDLNENLDKSFNSLNKQQDEISKLIKELSLDHNQGQTVLSVSDPADFCFNLALVNQEGGDDEQAIKNYTKALELNPALTQAYHNLGLIYMEKGDNRKAIDNLRKASQLYFKQNNLEKYQEIKNLSLQLYDNEKESNTNIQLNQDKIAAHNLFD